MQKQEVIKLLKKTPIIRSNEITAAGIDRKTIHRMVNNGDIIQIARGLYTSNDYIPGSHYSFLEAQKIVSHGVVCLLSALTYYEIGTQNPSLVWMAVSRRARAPQVTKHPIQIVRFSGKAYDEGIINQEIEGGMIHIYNIPKTIADCFKYRNKIGLEVALEALKDVIQNKKSTIDELIYYSDICRVKNIMTPYIESLI